MGKHKNDFQQSSSRDGAMILIVIGIIVLLATTGALGGLFGVVFELIGGVLGLVGGLIGLIFGFIGTVLGAVFGLIGTIFGVVFGVLGGLLGLVFGGLFVILPLILIAIGLKMIMGRNNDSSRLEEDVVIKRKRKNDEEIDWLELADLDDERRKSDYV